MPFRRLGEPWSQLGGLGIGFPSGTLSAFSPLDIANLIVWLDPSDITTLYQDAGITPVTADGQVIGRILDKSGNGNHYNQTTALNKPTYKASIQNGLGIARKVDTSDIMTGPAVGNYADITVYFIYKSGDSANHYLLSFGPNRDIIQGYVAGKIEWYNSPRTVIGNISTSVFQIIYTIVGNGANTLAWVYGGTTANGIGDMGELLVYSKEHNVATQMQIINYLVSKWGVANP